MSEVNQDEVESIRKAIEEYLKNIADTKCEPFFKKILKFQESLDSAEITVEEKEKVEGYIADQQSEILGVSDKFKAEAWLPDAAKRAGWIQLVSHTPKNMNSCAKGSSGVFCSSTAKSVPEDLVCSFSLSGKDELNDAVGNAAALDVNKFLQTKVNGRSLLSMLLDGDESLKKALSEDTETAQQIFNGFLEFIKEREPAAHSLTKQLYFPVNNGFRLLLPLYPSVLVSSVHEQLSSDFFSEEVKTARKARKANEYCAVPLHSYPELAVQSFGGSKPQNISQLNSLRHGKSYLLPSLPPAWNSPEIKAPNKSIFSSSLYYRKNVRYWVKALGDYLSKVKVDNMNTRYGRDKILAAIVDETLNYAMELRSLPAGWSDASECRLPEHEKKWLDPGSAKSLEIQGDDWLDEICRGFGLTLNARLKKYHKIEVDNVLFSVWKSGLLTEMKMFKWGLDNE